ncbi:MAG TPA: hypothetical protein VF648_08895 [Pyrinomonadaceae bacterium]|jgi:hypothetical protein
MKYKALPGSFCLLAGILFSYLIGVGINGWTPVVHAKQENSQEQEKIVKLAYSHKPIIKISELKVSGKARKFDESFSEDGDWLRDFSFKLENKSGKRIVYLQVNVNFPETRATGNMMSFPIVFGQFPDIDNQSKHPPLLLNQDNALEVSLNKEYDKLAKFINARSPIEFMRKVELEIGFVVFDDKTAWSGSYLRQDPNNPRRYIGIESDSPHQN